MQLLVYSLEYKYIHTARLWKIQMQQNNFFFFKEFVTPIIECGVLD